jgi:outer membrane lipoprotein-sorting protein
MKHRNKELLWLLLTVCVFIDFVYGISIEYKIKDAIYYSKTSYSGIQTIIFWSAKGKSIACEAKIFFKAPNKMRIEYEGNKNLSQHILIDNGEYEYLYDKTKNIAYVSISPHKNIGDIDEKFKLLKKNYQFVLLGSENIAGRVTDVVAIKSQNKENPWRKIWIDNEYHIILQDKTFQEDELLHLSNFTTINFPKELSDDLFILPGNVKIIPKTSKVTSFTDIKKLQEKTKFKLFLPSYIPEGYVFDKADLVEKKKYEFVRIQYSDGLNILSLFETPTKIDFRGYQEPEQIMNYKLVYRKYKGINFTIIGVLSHKMLSQIINSIK